VRVGWLELGNGDVEAPPELAAAGRRGVLRAASVGPHRAVVVKQRRGEPVLADVLREHFAGCTLVLVRGGVASPVLERADGGWLVRDEGAARRLSTAELVGRLRRPRLL